MNDLSTITSLLASITKIVHHTLQKKYHVIPHVNPNYEDIYQDVMLALTERAQTYNPKKGRFGTYCFYTIRNSILRSIASNNLISFATIDTFNRTKYNNKKEGLHVKVSLDELNEGIDKSLDRYNTIGVVEFDYGSLNDYPNFLHKALTETEYNLLMELCKLPRRRDKIKILKSLKKLAKLSDKRLMHSSYLVYWRHRLTKKVCDYYSAKGFKVRYPADFGSLNLKKSQSVTSGIN